MVDFLSHLTDAFKGDSHKHAIERRREELSTVRFRAVRSKGLLIVLQLEVINLRNSKIFFSSLSI